MFVLNIFYFQILKAVLQSKFDMELIVQCIRSSSSPQTHHHALLLLTVAAKINPVSNSLQHFNFLFESVTDFI